MKKKSIWNLPLLITMTLFTFKYAPKNEQQLFGQDQAVAELKDYIINYKKKPQRAALLLGPIGTGKTSSIYALARQLDYDLLEINSSDLRNEESMRTFLGSALGQQSLFFRPKIILVDEIDNISGREDRGCIPALVKVLEKSTFPVILTANDISDSKFKSLAKSCQVIDYHTLQYRTIGHALRWVCEQENIQYEEKAINTLARQADGDLRGALIDLQVCVQVHNGVKKQDEGEQNKQQVAGEEEGWPGQEARRAERLARPSSQVPPPFNTLIEQPARFTASGGEPSGRPALLSQAPAQQLYRQEKWLRLEDVEKLSNRKRTETIFNALTLIFKSSSIETALPALEDVDMELQEIIPWIDENLPKEYLQPGALAKAYEHLARADVFQGRIRRQQHWRFLVYINSLLTAGVSSAKKEKNINPVQYNRTMRFLRMWQAKMKWGKKKEIAAKLAAVTHTSERVAYEQVPYLEVLVKGRSRTRKEDLAKQERSEERVEELVKELKLSEEEVEWLKR